MWSKNKPLSIGITGGIGSGKSYVCRYLQSKGIPVLDTDAEAKRLMLATPQIHQALTFLIQTPCILSDGTLNKPALSAYLSASPTHAENVNRIIHPHVIQYIRQWFQEQSTPFVAVESALLFKAGIHELVDATLLVTAPVDLRIRRVMARDGRSHSQVTSLMALQNSDEELKRLSRFVVLNDEIHPVGEQVDRILQELSFQC